MQTDHNQRALPERLSHPNLPDDIILAFEPHRIETTGGDIDLSESLTGTLLLKKMADTYMNIPQIDVITAKYEKPKAFVDAEELSVSFSHTKTGLSAGISKTSIVGVDMEHVERTVIPRLTQRMKHPEENQILYENSVPIRIWTLKEAALKQIGTGLRKPMNSVKITQISSAVFDVEFDNGKQAKICSFQHKDHWISICYHNSLLP